MNGLIKKDWLLLKSYHKMLLVFFFIGGFLSLSLGLESVFCIVLSVLCLQVTLGYDNSCSWNIYASTLPISKRDVIQSKYCFATVLLIFGILSSIILTVGFGIWRNDIQIPISKVIWGSIVALGYLSISLPCSYRYGTEKGRTFSILGILILLGVFANIVLLAAKIPTGFWLHNFSFFVEHGMYLLFLFFCFGFYLSYRITVRIYAMKDL